MSALRGVSLTRGVVLNWLNFGFYIGATFLLTPIIISKLGKAGFGTWTLIQSLSGYYGIVNLGLASAMNRFIARDLAKSDQQSLQQTISTALAFFSGTGLVVLTLAALVGHPLAQFFNVPSREIPTFAWTVFFCAISVACEFFGGLTTAFLAAKERFDLTNALSVGRLLVQTVIILALLQYWPSISSLAAAAGFVAFLNLVVGWMVVATHVSEASFTWRYASYLRLKELLNYGASTVLMTVTNIIRLRVGNIIVAKSSGIAVVGAFSVATNLVANMNSVMAASLNVLNPRFTRLEAGGDYEGLRQLYRVALFLSSAMASWMGLLLFTLGERFLLFWIGPGMLDAVPIIKVLAVSYAIALAQAPAWNLMFALSKHHFMSRVSIIEAAGVLVLGLWFANLGGAIGFSYATAFMMIGTKIFIQPPYAARIAGLTVREYFAPIATPLLVAGTLAVAAHIVSLEAALRDHGLLFFGVVTVGLTFVFAALVLMLSRQRRFLPVFLKRVVTPGELKKAIRLRSAINFG